MIQLEGYAYKQASKSYGCGIPVYNFGQRDHDANATIRELRRS